VWGKPTKRGFISFRGIKITAANTQKFLTEIFSQQSALLLSKSTQPEQAVRPCSYQPVWPSYVLVWPRKLRPVRPSSARPCTAPFSALYGSFVGPFFCCGMALFHGCCMTCFFSPGRPHSQPENCPLPQPMPFLSSAQMCIMSFTLSLLYHSNSLFP
jgi:hypothetical protein